MNPNIVELLSMITEQSHFCGIKDSLIRLKVVLQGLLPVTESRLENT
jgi:hypothetical protein